MENPNRNQGGQSGTEKSSVPNLLTLEQSQRQEAEKPLTGADIPDTPRSLKTLGFHAKVVQFREQLIQDWERLVEEMHSQATGNSSANHFSPKKGWEIVEDCKLANMGYRKVIGEKYELVADGQ